MQHGATMLLRAQFTAAGRPADMRRLRRIVSCVTILNCDGAFCSIRYSAVCTRCEPSSPMTCLSGMKLPALRRGAPANAASYGLALRQPESWRQLTAQPGAVTRLMGKQRRPNRTRMTATISRISTSGTPFVPDIVWRRIVATQSTTAIDGLLPHPILPHFAASCGLAGQSWPGRGAFAVHRSFPLNDQTNADRHDTRGGNPRRCAGR